MSPLLGGLTKWAKGLETWINNARINSCETAKALVSTAAEAVGYDSQEACAELAIEMGMESDSDAAMRRCATDRPSILASARSSADPNIAAQGALRRQPDLEGAAATGTSWTIPERELIMSIVGTVIFYARGQPTAIPSTSARASRSIGQLLYGQSAAAGGNVNAAPAPLQQLHRLRRGDARTPPTRTRRSPTQGRDHDALDRGQDPHARGHPEQLGRGRLRQPDQQPVCKMLSIGTTIPGSGLVGQC